MIPATGGVSRYYQNSTWGAEYPEVSGYIIPTLYDAAAILTGDSITLREHAAEIANWEHSIQAAPGNWDWVFDTGQVILGMVRAYQETNNAAYLTDAVEAGDWLVSIQEADGSWITSEYGDPPHSYNTRVAWALLELWQETDDIDYKNAAIKNLDWAVSQQQANGWFAQCGMISGEMLQPLTHTLSYTGEGLIEAGIILNDATYKGAAKKLADAYIAIQQADGSLGGGQFRSNWTAAVVDECLTGTAQASHIFWELYHQGYGDAYKTAGLKANQYLRSVQSVGDVNIWGGVNGCYPYAGPNGGYFADTVLSWATKFFADAMILEILYG